jgi:predicted transcriptional regulator
MKNLSLRIPDDLYLKLKAMAEADERSLHSMLVLLLKRALQSTPR